MPRWVCLPLNAPAFAGRTSVRRVCPSTASRPACQVRPADPHDEEQRTPTPGLSQHVRTVYRHPSHASTLRRRPGSESWSIEGFRVPLCERRTSLPQGPLAPARVLLSRTLVAYCDPIRQSREHAAPSRFVRLYAAPSLCGSASATRGTFPTFAAVLSRRAVDHTPVGPRCCPVTVRTPVPGFLALSPSRRPQKPASASNIWRGIVHDAASFASCCGPSVCLDLLTGSDPVASRARHPAFCGRLSFPLSRAPLPCHIGNQAKWANGKSPIVGTCTRPVTCS